jgi:hypothetical protein
MPNAPPLIPFQLKLTTDDPDLILKGNILAIEDVVSEVSRGVNVPPRAGDQSLGLIAGHYAYIFNASKIAKFKLSAVTPADPEPTPKEFDSENGGQLGRVFYFVVSLP